jgi:hypothetical protein
MQSGYGSKWTSGTWLFSRSNLHYYYLIPAHVIKPCQSCGYYNSGAHQSYENSPSNWFDELTPSQIVYPIDPAFAYYDMVLIDFGTSNWAPTNLVWNYCTASNCSSFQGGGTQVNPNWAGWHYHIDSATSAQPGWGVVLSKSISGTSWAQVSGAYHVNYSGWDYWGIRIQGVSGCGIVHGDSGSPVTTGNNNEVYVGMLTSAPDFTSFFVPGPSPCYGASEWVNADGTYIDWYSVQVAYPGLALMVYTGV